MCDGTLESIEEVESGDWVWSRDEATVQEACRQVVGAKVTPDQPVIEVQTESSDGQTEVFGVTAEHPFWVVEQGWVRVSGATWTSSRQTVYNFEVEGFHTYFVGESEAWVHNADCVGLHEGYRPEPGKRTMDGYVEGVVDDVGKEVTILNEAGDEIRRFGSRGKHNTDGPHVHPDYWNLRVCIGVVRFR
jgi:hypothetical protein